MRGAEVAGSLGCLMGSLGTTYHFVVHRSRDDLNGKGKARDKSLRAGVLMMG